MSNTEQRGILAVRRDVTTLQRREEYVSNMVPRSRNAVARDVTSIPEEEENV